MKNEIIPVYPNQNVTTPFIFTTTGSSAFYADEHRITIVETAPIDDRRKSFYLNLTKDEDLNYELYVRVNPTRMLQTIGNFISAGSTIIKFFSPTY